LKVRLKSTCVPGPWISDPRYGCRRSELEGASRVDFKLPHGADFRMRL
jgi:hypothetical protein